MTTQTTSTNQAIPTQATETTQATLPATDTPENAGLMFPWSAQLEVPNHANFRPVSIQFRAKKDKNGNEVAAVRQSVYCQIPTDHLTLETIVDNIELLAPYYLAMTRKVEDDSVNYDYKVNKVTRVFPESFSLDNLISLLDSAAGSSLTPDDVTQWYNDEVQDSLILAKLVKAGIDPEACTDEQIAKVSKLSANIRDQLIVAATGKTKYVAPKREQLAIAIHQGNAESTIIGSKILAKFRAQDEEERKVLESVEGGEYDLQA